jgi:hypothetical protein
MQETGRKQAASNVIYFSETSAEFQCTTGSYIPENRTLHEKLTIAQLGAKIEPKV